MPWEPIPYADNAPIIALLEAPPHGLYPTIDSQCRAPNTSGRTLCATLHAQHAKVRGRVRADPNPDPDPNPNPNPNPNLNAKASAAIFGAPQLSRKERRTSEEHFLLRHFAGDQPCP